MEFVEWNETMATRGMEMAGGAEKSEQTNKQEHAHTFNNNGNMNE